MGKMANQLKISNQDKIDLELLASDGSSKNKMSIRAKMVLMCSEGDTIVDIASELGTYPNKVICWRERYREAGIFGLYDKEKSGRAKKYDKVEVLNEVKELLKSAPPKGMGEWDGKTIAKKLKINKHSLWQILRENNISLKRRRSWCISTDPEFTKKAADIVGLYLDPPMNAIVISVDEKPSIQALERKQGFIRESSGKIVRGYKSTYKRHGTINLFAALQVHTGKVHGKFTARKTKVDFLEFMDDVVADHSEEVELHVVLDNYSSHKKLGEWLTKNPNVKFHYTPTSASWLNQIEIWFSILSRKSLKGFSAKSVDDIITQIKSFIEQSNKNCKPFKWRKREVKGSQLKNTIDNIFN